MVLTEEIVEMGLGTPMEPGEAGDTAAVTAMLDRLLHHAHVLKCGPRSWRSKEMTALQSKGAQS
jgi:hypothetical protein